MPDIFCSDLPNDQDMIHALNTDAIPLPGLFTDACFGGAESKLIAVERKKVGDMADAILSGRFLYQAQVCKEQGSDVLALIVEGDRRSNPEDGMLEVPVWRINPRTMRRAEFWEQVRPVISYSRFEQYLIELDYLAGIIVKRSRDVKETAAIIRALRDQFQTPPDGHKSLHQIFSSVPRIGVDLVRPGLVRRVAKELPGIGYERSRTVAEHFKSVREMCNADAEEWSSLEGIGQKTAEKVILALGGAQ